MNDLILQSHASTDPMLGGGGMRSGKRAGSVTSPRDLLFVLFWHRRKVVTFFVVASLLTALAVVALPSTYRSESTLLVKLGSEAVNVDPSAGLGGPMISPVIGREMQMKTELEVLKSREIATAVVKRIGAGRILRKDIAPGETSDADPIFRNAVMALNQNLSLDVVPDSSVLSVAYESGDPKLAKDITTVYVAQYLTHRTSVYSNSANASFLQGERDTTLKKVSELQEQIKQIKDEARVGNPQEQRQILQGRIGAMNNDAADARTKRVIGEAEVAKLTEQMKSVPRTVVQSTTHNPAMNHIDDLRKDIAKLEQELVDAQSRFMPGHPQIIQLQDRLAGRRTILEHTVNDPGESVEAMNDTYKELDRRLENARIDTEVAHARETAILSEIAKVEAQLRTVNDVELKIANLLRTANLREDALKLISQASDRAEILTALQGEKLNNVSVVQPATMPLKPIAPNRLMLLVLGMFVAGSGAIGLGIAAETLSRSTKRPEDIDRMTHLPCVSVPIVEAHGYLGSHSMAAQQTSMMSRLLHGPKTVSGKGTSIVTRAAGTATAATPRLTHSDGTNGVNTPDVRPMRRWSPQLLQAAHGIIDGLLFDAIQQAKGKRTFITGLVSCRPGQGASTLSSYVASAIADRLEASLPLHPNDHVLLIDADLADPSLHRLLGVSDAPGVGDWLASATNEDAALDRYVQPTNHSRLSLMPAGHTHQMTHLLDRVDRLFDEARLDFRHLVVDLPPVSGAPTTLRLAAKCDAVLLIVECGNLHQEVVRRSVRALQAAGANVAGVVLNKRRFPIPDWLYERSS